MKKIFLSALLITLSALFVFAQGTALIKFEKTSHNFGSFSESNPKVTCTFKFTNAGDGPLVIHQAIASCGCTVPQYPKEPIKPGESGIITVTYDGEASSPDTSARPSPCARTAKTKSPDWSLKET